MKLKKKSAKGKKAMVATIRKYNEGGKTKKQAKTSVIKALTVLGKEDLFKEKIFEILFNKVDADGDGALNEEEFVNLIDHFINKS